MTSVAQHRRAVDHKKIALQRICGVCRFFIGETIRSGGICDKFGKQTSGTTQAGRCDHWTRKIAGLDQPAKIAVDLETPLTPQELAGAVAFMAQPLDLAPPPELLERDDAAAFLDALVVAPAPAPVPPPVIPVEDRAKIGARPEKVYPVRPVQDAPAPKKVPSIKRQIDNAVAVVEARRARLRELLARRPDVTAKEAGDELDLPAWQVRGDAKALGVELKRAPSRYDPSVADLRDRVKEAFDGVRTIAEIAGIVGAHVRTVRGHLDALELKAPAGKAGRSREAEERIAARQRRVRALVEAGKLSRSEIAAELKISTRTLSEDMAALEITLPAGRAWPQRDAVIEASSGPSRELVEASRALSAQAHADGEALSKRAGDMIRLARNCSLALYALADELEVFLKRQEAGS